jgi:hypothetical protein
MDILHHLVRVVAQGGEAALRAYTRASDAYAEGTVASSVAVWSVGIAVGVVLLEWVVAQRRRGR